jgi:transposase InsO family protein
MTVGKTERYWETLKRELWDRVHPKDLEEARVRVKHFVAHHNHQRPHQSLDGLVPADRFFGVASEVRAAVEAEIAKNELRLALGRS